MLPPLAPPPPVAPGVQLGAAADLLRGLLPVWSDPARSQCPFFAPPEQPFLTLDPASAAAPPREGTGWSGPVLSVHADVGSLLDALFDYRVLPFAPRSPGFDVPVRTLLLPPERRGSTLAALGAFFGLDLAAHDGGFVLLKMRRVTAECRHEALASGTGRRIQIDHYWTAEGRHAMGRLRVARRIVNGADREAVVSGAQAGRYLDYFHRLGTHFVARVALGDLLLQVLAVHPARFPALEELWRREAGGSRVVETQALGFRHYLGPKWIAARGRIVSVGDHPAVAASLAAGEWHDARFAHGDSLLQPLAGRPELARALAAGSLAPCAVGIDFAPQSAFMEVFRADAWKRLLKGALLQRFGPAIRIPPARLPAPLPVPARALPRGELRAADALVRFDVVAEYPAGTDVPLPGRRVLLGAYRADACPPEGDPPVIRLQEAALGDFEFVAGAMSATLFVVEADGQRRDTVCEGFRFTDDPANPGRVILRAPLVVEAESLLATLIDGVCGWMEALYRRQPAAAGFSRGFFDWLTVIWSGQPARASVPAHSGDETSRSQPHGFIEPTALAAFAREVLATVFQTRTELRDPAAVPVAAWQAAADGFARLADRAGQWFPAEPAAPAGGSENGTPSMSLASAQAGCLREQGRLLEAMMRLCAVPDGPPPEVFDLPAAAHALLAAVPGSARVNPPA